MLAHEPASWYYAIPKFSRNHLTALTNIRLFSARVWHFLMCLGLLTGITAATYIALLSWSETAAIVAATLVFYFLIVLIANYRVARYYSVYTWQNNLVVNNAWWGIMVIDTSDIISAQIGVWSSEQTSKHLKFGRGNANVKLSFSRPQLYFSAMATIKDKSECLYLSVESPEKLKLTKRALT